MFDLSMSSELEHVDLAHEVGADVGLWIGQRVSDPGLRTEMHDPVEPVRRCEGFERFLVAKIYRLKRKGIAMCGAQAFQPGVFQRSAVIVSEVIDPEHLT